MKLRALLLLLVLPMISDAGVTIPCKLSFDGNCYTAYLNGDAPQGGSCPATYTCAAYGDGTVCDVDDNTGTWTVTAASPIGDEEGGCFIYKTAATAQDIHSEFQLSATITGFQPPWAGCGVRFEATGGYQTYNWSPLQDDFPRVKEDAGGAGEAAHFGATSAVRPEYMALDYDTSEGSVYGGNGSDGTAWTEYADFLETLTFPVKYGPACWGDGSASTTTFIITNVADGATLELSGGGSGPPPTLLAEYDFNSATWYNAAGWGAGGADQGGPTNSPRFGCQSAGEVNQRVTSGENGVALIDGDMLRMRIVSGKNCGSNAGIYLTELMPSLPGPGDSMYVRYYIAFGDNFDNDPATSGKFPGWSDDGTGACGSGGAPCDGTDGWSARGKVYTGGGCAPDVPVDSYVYHADMPGNFGDHFDWANMGCGEANVPTQGTWDCLEHKVTMNTGSNNDGEYDVWANGVQVLDQNDFKWDTTGNFPIYRFWMNMYHGGAATAPQNMDMYIDHIAISESAIGCDL